MSFMSCFIVIFVFYAFSAVNPVLWWNHDTSLSGARAMRDAAKVFSDASSLTTTGQPLTLSTRLMTVRVTSRRFMDCFCSSESGDEYIKIKRS